MTENVTTWEPANNVTAAITTRHSIRAFLSTPVPREIVEEILSVARRAPSGTNMQPWWVYVVTDDGKNRLSDALLKAHDGGSSACSASLNISCTEGSSAITFAPF